MNRNQENKLNMYLAVEGVMNEYPNLWNSVPVLNDLMTEFTDVISQIEGTRIVQEQGTGGVTMDKAEAREQASLMAVRIADALVILGTRTNNHGLTERMRVTPSGLGGIRDTAATAKFRAIYQEAVIHETGLVTYGITPILINQFLGHINTYRNSVALPRLELGKGVNATGDLLELFAQCDLILKDQLDRVMESYRESAPVFLGRYESARVIVDLGGGGGADGNTGDLPPVE
jgi:hypothetical protein